MDGRDKPGHDEKQIWSGFSRASDPIGSPLHEPYGCEFVTAARQTVFWVGTLAAVVIAVVLLREILFPFVAGMGLAYLLDAPVNRLQRFGMNRAAATLLILGGVFCGVIALIFLTAPFVGAEIVDDMG